MGDCPVDGVIAKLIGNWTNPEFVKFVSELAGLVDRCVSPLSSVQPSLIDFDFVIF